MRKLLILACLCSGMTWSQTTPSSLLITRIFNITNTWPGECAAGVIDNRSMYTRQNNYHSFFATGTGTWSVTMEFSDTSCAGPFTSYGPQAIVNQATNPQIGFGTDGASYHQFITFVFSGANANTVQVTYSAVQNFFLSTTAGVLTFPLNVSQGGTGFGSCTSNGFIYGNGTSALQCLTAGSQYQVAQAGSGGVPTIGAVQLAQPAAITGNLPSTNGGTGAASPTAHTVAVAEGASAFTFAGPGSSGQPLVSNGSSADPTYQNLSVPAGGTGLTTATAHGVLLGEGASALGVTGPGTPGQVLTSTGSSSDPTFQALPAALPSGTQSQYLQIQPNTGNNTTTRFVTLPVRNVADFNWPSQSPAQTLSNSGGAQTIALSPFPNGITATSVNASSVYITDSTSGNEAVQVVGVSLGVSITIAQPVHNHTSGQWSIGPATGGTQECAEIAMASGGSCYISSASPVTFHAAVVVPGTNAATFTSDSYDVPSVIRASDYLSGDLFYSPGVSFGSGGTIDLFNIDITNGANTSTAIAIHIKYGSLLANGLHCTNGVFIDLDSSGNTQVSNFGYYLNNPALSLSHAILIESPSANRASTNGRFSNGLILGQWLGAGLEITAADSWDFDTMTIDGMQTLVLIDPPTGGSYVTNMRFHGMELDCGSASTVCTQGFKVVPQATVIIGSINLTAVDFLGYNVAAEAFAINLGAASSGYIGDFIMEGVHVFSWNTGISVGALGFGGARSLIINDSTIVGNIVDGIDLNSPRNVTITGSVITNNGGFGVNVTGTASGLTITGNTFANISWSNTSGPITYAVAAITSNANVITGNTGIDNVIPAVASAANITFPVNPNFTITGTTNVTAITATNMAPGATGTLRSTGGTITFTGGAGNIGNSFIAQQNVPALWEWDGTSLWLGSQSPSLSNTYNYIASETGVNNAIAGALTGVTLGSGLRVTIALAHTLQAGANTFALNGGAAVAIKSSRNTANNIATLYASGGTVTLLYDGTQWEDVSQ